MIVAAWIERAPERALAYPAETALPDATLRTVQVPPLGPCEIGSASLVHAGQPIEVLLVSLEHDGLRTTLALVPTP